MTDIQITPKWKDVKPEGFYVYIHRRATDGTPFYVGKGHGYRGWRYKDTRNKHWINVAGKNGVILEIYKDGLSECCSFSLEKILIDIYGIDNLCNISHGGEGKTGILGDYHHNYRYDEFEFIHKDGDIFSGTSYEFRNKYNLKQGCVSNLVNGVRKSHKGWRLSSTSYEETGMRGEKIWNYDRKIRKFYHRDGSIFEGTQRQLINEYGICPSNVSFLVRGRIKSAYGWYLDEHLSKNGAKSGARNPSYDGEIRVFTNKDGRSFIGTQYQFRVKFGLDFRCVSSIVTGRTKAHKGWSVNQEAI